MISSFLFISGMVYMIANYNKIWNILSLHTFINIVTLSVTIVLALIIILNAFNHKIQIHVYITEIHRNAHIDEISNVMIQLPFMSKLSVFTNLQIKTCVFQQIFLSRAVRKVCGELQMYQITNQKSKTWP